jgi:hypothetical protein
MTNAAASKLARKRWRKTTAAERIAQTEAMRAGRRAAAAARREGK